MTMNHKKGTRLWKKAKSIIPGGSQLLSKRAEQFLPDQWPSFFSRAKGIQIWDLDDNELTDVSLMGVGTCILGYADDDVDIPVKNAIDKGVMTTLNCPEEVELAELLLKIHPWAGGIRFSKTGGEAMAIAVRIARAFSGKDTVAFSGYHGWHDWYLASNLANDKNLDGHLLPGLNPLGVPRCLINTSIPFNYNRIEELEKIVGAHDVGVIVLEPLRHFMPEPGFLENVRKIADDIGAVLVFDEVSSGWRMTVGGAHTLFGVTPDIVVYAKGMSNGYPMAAIVGKEEIMDVAQSSFISSTYWTDRIGSVAALATINKLKKFNIPDTLRKNGRMISAGWEKISREHDLPLAISSEGLDSVPSFVFTHEQGQMIRTLFTQEMLKRNYLASNIFYVAAPHDRKVIERYLDDVNDVFAHLRKAIDTDTVETQLKGPVAHTGFKKIT